MDWTGSEFPQRDEAEAIDRFCFSTIHLLPLHLDQTKHRSFLSCASPALDIFLCFYFPLLVFGTMSMYFWSMNWIDPTVGVDNAKKGKKQM